MMTSMKNYLVTSRIPGAGVNKNFIKSLKCLAKDHRAEYIEIYTKPNYKGDMVHNCNYEDRPLNDNLIISSMKFNVNLVDPLSGLDSFGSKRQSVIFAFPRQRFKTIPRSLKSQPTPVGLWCTGTISEPYYKDTKSGHKMRNYHKYGALLVTVKDNKVFHIRQIEANDDGSCYDLLKLYKPSGKITKVKNIHSISLGDIHPSFINQGVKQATFKLLKKLRPDNVFYHDSFDASSITHHEEGKYITKALIRDRISSLKAEIELTAKCLNEFGAALPSSKHYIVASNHDEHLYRYLNEFRFRDDATNLIYSLELATRAAMYRRGLVDSDALEYSLKQSAPLFNFNFLKRTSSLQITDRMIEMANHGDEGNNGARGSGLIQSILFLGNSITGHTHSPDITPYGGYVGGTCTNLSLPYTKDSGGSSWLNTHTLIYPSGTRTHIHLIDIGNGKYEYC